jgi:Tfp pilus assembly protein PilF
MSFPLRRSHRASVVVALLALGACRGRDAAPPPAAAETEAQMMDRGTQQLYKAGDPVAAESTFRAVLAKNPTHYGAHYQLAVALDRGGKPTEARTEWQEALRLAESFNDTTTVRAARARLAAPDTASQAAVMARGVDLMYRQNNPVAAIEQFQAILARNRTHYGATYQLAVALDRAGRSADAKKMWERVLPMALQYRDQKVIDTARARLR